MNERMNECDVCVIYLTISDTSLCSPVVNKRWLRLTTSQEVGQVLGPQECPGRDCSLPSRGWKGEKDTKNSHRYVSGVWEICVPWSNLFLGRLPWKLNYTEAWRNEGRSLCIKEENIPAFSLGQEQTHHIPDTEKPSVRPGLGYISAYSEHSWLLEENCTAHKLWP